MLTLFPLLAVLAAAPDELTVTRSPEAVTMHWADTEERVDVTIRPAQPVASEPFTLWAQVGSFYGAPFTGPVQVSLKSAESSQSLLVPRSTSAQGWVTELTVPTDGEFSLELGFATTRRKQVHAPLHVAPARVPRWPWYIALAAVAAGLLAFGLRSALRPQESA